VPKTTRGLPLRVFLTLRIARRACLCLLRLVLICDDCSRVSELHTPAHHSFERARTLSRSRVSRSNQLAMDAYTGQGGSAGGQGGADDAFRLPALASLAAASSSAAMSPPSGSSSHIPLPSLRYRMLGQAGAAQQSFPSMDALAGTSYEQAASGGMGESMSPPPLGTDANGRKMSAGQKRKSSTTPGDADSEAGKAKKVRPFPPVLVALAQVVLIRVFLRSQRRLERATRAGRARFGASDILSTGLFAHPADSRLLPSQLQPHPRL
jgi:hypothetical protein